MIVSLGVFLVSLGLALALTPLVRHFAGPCGLIDAPDRRRKLHARIVPVGGGIAVLLAAAGGVLTVFLLANPWQEELAEHRKPLLSLLVAALVICGVGLLDDLRLLRGRHKLMGQIAAVGVVMLSGVMVERVQLFGYQIDLGLLAIPFTFFLLLGSINSLNLLDGMDGMLGTVGLIISLAMAGMALLSQKVPAACVALALAGALLGFLRYNWPPASIFLGDTGSMLIGLTIGVLAIHSSLKGPATVALASPLALLIIPITDTTAAILRRKLTGRSIYTTDRGHLHHCLLRRGFSTWGVLGAVSVLCTLAVLGALVSTALNNELFAILSAISVVGLLVGIRLFGYGEFLLVKQRSVAFLTSLLKLRSTGRPLESEVRLQGSADWGAVWSSVTTSATRLNLYALCLDVNAPAIHESYHARWVSRPDDPENLRDRWNAEFPLLVDGLTVGRLTVTGNRDVVPVWEKIAALTELVESIEQTLVALSEPPVSALPGVNSTPLSGVVVVSPRSRNDLIVNEAS